jgi:membrane protease YdiL (CAAX protease family)
MVPLAVAFEFALGGISVLLGWLFGIDPLEALSWRDGTSLIRDVGWGLLAVIPLLVLLGWARRSQFGAVRHVRERLQDQLMPHFARATPLDLAWVSVAAGVGEELLFRGFLQPLLDAHLNPEAYGGWLPLVLTSLLFGLAHFVSWTYLLLATSVGLYLGLLLIGTGSLWTPVVTHAVYDFLALWTLQRDFGEKKERPDQD